MRRSVLARAAGITAGITAGLAVGLAATPPAAARAPTAAPAGDAAAGALLAGLAGCEACHTAPGQPAGAGGYAIVTEHGTFYSPNITPDPQHGTGAWTWPDFVDAMRRGRAPDGSHYYPAFPYGSFTGMSDADLADLWAWMQALPPVDRPDQPHALQRYRWRGALALWKLAELRRGPLLDDPARDAELNRGRYLVQAVAHCGECHTPRNGIGGLVQRRDMAGTDADPEPGPNITPHPDGVGGWTVEDWDTLLALGLTPEGDVVGGEMGNLVRRGTAALSAADRRAIARWMIEGVQPQPSR